MIRQMEFINRKQEIGHLNKEHSEKGSKFVVLYGRRRIGKTRLIEEFMKNKEAVYYLAAQETDRQQIAEFKNVLNETLKDEFLASADFTDWKNLFSYLEKVWPKDKRVILAIDEVTYLIKSNPSFTSYLQKFWDMFLSKTNTFLVLSGSLVSLITEEILSKESPLHGRRTSQIKLEPLLFVEAVKFMKGHSIDEKIRFYAIVGGVPKYLLFITESSFEEFIKRRCFSREGFFYPEGIFLLSQEVKEPSTYLFILKAIASGNSKMAEISNYTGIESKKISGYMEILFQLGFVSADKPVTIKNSFRGSIYKINDNFLAFWHAFIYPGRSKIEISEGNEVYKQNKDNINAFVGRKFEEVCRQFIAANLGFSETGAWWGSERINSKREEIEIDIVGLKPDAGEIIFAECKWQDDVDAREVLALLKQKSAHVEWLKAKRKEAYAVFAKSFLEKNPVKLKKELSMENVLLFDLKDIEKWANS